MKSVVKIWQMLMMTLAIGLLVCAGAFAQAAAETGGMDMPVRQMEFINEEILNIYRVLGEVAGWNVIADPTDVRGQITLKLGNMSLKEALDQVGRVTGYSYLLEGNTLTIASAERMRTMVKSEVAFIQVANLNPQTARSLVLAAVPGINVLVDEGSNRLLVTGTSAQVALARSVIAEHDVATKQRFDFQNEPITSILRTLAINAGISYMIIGEIPGTLSIVLSDMAPREAFDYIVKRAGLVAEVSPEGILQLKPASEEKPTEAAAQSVGLVTDETRLFQVRYLPVAHAMEIISAAYPELVLKAGQNTSIIAATGKPSVLTAAAQLLAWHDFPPVRLGGIIQQGPNTVALLSVENRSHVVKQGDSIGELLIESVTAQGVTVKLGERREFIPVGGSK
ncbi:MAG TPA: hypothetical protein GXX29_02040 [Firmicutes bacterium]|nr:hypothetical protein [Bacillota bacterium]